MLGEIGCGKTWVDAFWNISGKTRIAALLCYVDGRGWCGKTLVDAMLLVHLPRGDGYSVMCLVLSLSWLGTKYQDSRQGML